MSMPKLERYHWLKIQTMYFYLQPCKWDWGSGVNFEESGNACLFGNKPVN